MRHIVERGVGPGTFGIREMDPWHDYIPCESGLLVPSSVIKKKEKPKGVDLFCGAGGFSLGFTRAGFEVVAALDSDIVCMHTYLYNLGGPDSRIVFVEPEDKERWDKYRTKAAESRKNSVKKGDHPEWKRMQEEDIAGLYDNKWGGGHHHYHPDEAPVGLFILGDAHKVTGDFILSELGLKRGDLGCVFGSPPCQGFSSAGKRSVMDSRNSLVFDWARLVVEMLPTTCCMENVPGLVSMVTPEGLNVIDCLCRILEDGGMGTFDALKRSLAATSGAGAMMRSSPREKKSEKKTTKKKVEQPTLL